MQSKLSKEITIKKVNEYMKEKIKIIGKYIIHMKWRYVILIKKIESLK